MENILLPDTEIEVFDLENNIKIADAKVISIKKHEIGIEIINGIDKDLNFGRSIQCRFIYNGKNVRFNAKIKNKNSFFLIGEFIFDNEKNYLRVDDNIKLTYKKIHLSEIEMYMNEVFSIKDNYVSLPSLLDRKDPYFKVIEYLISKIDELNETVSTLTDLLQNGKNSVFEEFFVNISASGMKIRKQENVKVGDILYIEVKPEINMRFHIIKIIGEVIKVNNKDFIIEYRMISNRSKEMIIRYSLQKERENILKNRK